MINIWKNIFFGEMDLLGAASLNRLKYLDINGSAFLLYILKGRLKTMLFLCLLATTYVGILSVSLYAGFMGMMAGIFLSTAAMRYGIKGIFLIIAGTFPQYLLLVPAYLMLMRWCWQICAGLYYPHKVYENGYGMRQQYYMKKLLQLTIILVAIFIGSLIESYVNPILLSRFLKMF
ncbi:stage II sporulation protein M [Kineothrix sp. MB12-C1]|uniref:stage II sporulation protein M n=1 Tax=Kineothrix sp. MB12-C1 TaxID=3070215 RepID=UPI0027D31430|nr:stage II sporulation protein M [Kineothrix sp. MB12-C1]WMC92905.1 stage II sporulation protein M [Kineothrix sp. MB12-C1]